MTDMKNRLKGIENFMHTYAVGLFEGGEHEKGQIYLPEDICRGIGNPVEVVYVHDGLVSPQRLYSEGQDDTFHDFLNAYHELWEPKNPELVEEMFCDFIKPNPEMVVDLCIGYGNTTRAYIDFFRERGNNARVVGIDKSGKCLKGVRRNIPYAELYLGEILKSGEIINVPRTILDRFSKLFSNGNMVFDDFNPSVFQTQESKSAMANRACGTLSDKAGECVIRYDFDSFIIERCYHDDGMIGREFFDGSLDMPLTERVFTVTHNFYPDLLEYCGGCESSIDDIPYIIFFVGAEQEAVNLILADLYRQAVALDLAIYMEENGYDTKIARLDQYCVYGIKN